MVVKFKIILHGSNMFLLRLNAQNATIHIYGGKSTSYKADQEKVKTK